MRSKREQRNFRVIIICRENGYSIHTYPTSEFTHA
jgi:hypothetical protein